MFTTKIRGDTELVTRLAALPDSIRRSLRAKTWELALRLEALVKAKLTNQVLHVLTGALRASIASEITEDATGVRGRVFSSGDVKYAAIHEFGGYIPPHDIYPSKARALHFVVGSKEIFAAHVRFPGADMPERSYLRSSLEDMRSEIVEGLRQAATTGARDALRRR